MATLGAGYVYGSTETVTNAKLAALVNNATLSNVTQTDIAAGEGLVYVGTSAPSDTDRVWVDTNSTPVILRYYNSTLSAWVPSMGLGVYTSRTSQTGAAGRVLIFDTSNSNSYKYTSTAGDTKFLGIETGSIANAASAPVVNVGSVTTLLEISASAGTYIRTSTATGKAEPCVNTAAGVFGFLTEAGTASARSHIFGIDPNGTLDQTAAYTWTGNHIFDANLRITSASGTTTNWTPLVQIVNTNVGTSATGSTTVNADSSIPQQSAEGTQFMTLAITPKGVNNTLKITVRAMLASSVGNRIVGCLFQDSTENALAVAQHFSDAGSSDTASMITITHYMTAGTTSATTFKFKAGGSYASTITFNGEAAATLYGGVANSGITIEEYKA